MNKLDLSLARAARYLVDHHRADLATKLLSCELISDLSRVGHTVLVHIQGNREMYELLWGTDSRDVSGSPQLSGSVDALAYAFKYAGGEGKAYYLVKFFAEYGTAKREAAEQTEMYMYVFGDDPIGQQVQVLDVGPHSAPTRQLIVSPVPVLPVTDLVRDDKLCFVAMPFAPQFRAVYDFAITPAITAAGLTCRRADDISQPGAVLTQIWQSMLQARLVVADLSGGNGNVLYELGLAHVLGHEAILLTQDINNVPFDLRHQRTIVYSTQGDGLDSLRTSLMAAIQNSLVVKR